MLQQKAHCGTYRVSESIVLCNRFHPLQYRRGGTPIDDVANRVDLFVSWFVRCCRLFGPDEHLDTFAVMNESALA
jgi:hypothetical protein